MRILLVIVLMLSAKVACTQPFESVNHAVGLELIAAFAENREKFVSFACKGMVTVELATSSNELHPRGIEFAVLENQEKRSSRSIVRVQGLSDSSQTAGWKEIYTIKGKKILGGPKHAPYSDEYVQRVVKMDWLPTDPWSWSYISCAGLDRNKEDALLWMQVFREDKLLRVQDNGKLVRAEWDVGPEARIQAYFNPDQGNMPNYCRYIMPVDKNEEFSKRSRLLFNEIETEWAEHGEGWVPIKVRNYRETLNANGKVSSSETWNFSLDWNSKLIKDGVVNDNVFEMGKVNLFTILDSFSKGTNPKPD